jgi:hypothetical protein
VDKKAFLFLTTFIRSTAMTYRCLEQSNKIFNNNNKKNKFLDKIDHIVSACPILAKEQYIKMQDRVCTQLHFNICKEIWGKIGQRTLVSACTKISRNKSRRQRNRIVESTTAD